MINNLLYWNPLRPLHGMAQPIHRASKCRNDAPRDIIQIHEDIIGVCIGYIVKFGICGDWVQDFRVERVISMCISYNNLFVKLIINLVVQLLISYVNLVS